MKAKRLMTRREVADLCRVDPQTVTNWIRSGRLPQKAIIRLPGGQNRFIEEEIIKLLEGK